MNNLTEEDAIYPDQQLLIVPASKEITTPTGTPDPDQFTPTLKPTQTLTPTAEITQEEPEPTPTPKERNNFLVNIFSGDTLWLGIGLVAVSVLGIGLLLFTSSRLK